MLSLDYELLYFGMVPRNLVVMCLPLRLSAQRPAILMLVGSYLISSDLFYF